MKWTKKGHELDGIFEQLSKKENFYLFGAGDYGKQFYEIIKNEIAIEGYIDNDLHKQGRELNGYMIYSLPEIKRDKTIGIIVAVSQVGRSAVVEQLEAAGYVSDVDYFKIEQFLSIWYVYKYDKVYFSNISMLPSTACNLNCECCLNFNPYAKHADVRNWENVKEDIDLFFKCVDYVMLYHVSGGEPFLYPYIGDVIEYLGTKYRKQILTLRTVTNGTVIPSDALLERLSQIDFEVTVDDYREAVPQYEQNFHELIRKLEQYHIRYEINTVDAWIDLAPTKTDYRMWTEEKLIEHFDNCNQTWQELRDGKLFSCNYDGYATVAGINEVQKEEIFDLRNYKPEQAKELVEFRLGFNAKGYTNLCRHCRGFYMDNPLISKPAKQVVNNNNIE